MDTRNANNIPCRTCGRLEREHSVPFEYATLSRDCRTAYIPAEPAIAPEVLAALPPIDLIEASAKHRIIEALARAIAFHTPARINLPAGQLSQLAQDLYDDGVRFKDETALKNWSPR